MMKLLKSSRMFRFPGLATTLGVLGAVAVTITGTHAQTQSAAPTTSTTASSIKALDTLFKELKPDQKLVYVGDMGFKVDTLKKWRDYLASPPILHSTRSSFDWAENLTWPNKRVPYVFDSSVPSDIRDMFHSAIYEWQKSANVRWEEKQAGDSDYVAVYYSASGAMNSAVGRAGGSQALNINNTANIARVAHEIAHAQGVIHEQNRFDRDTYVTVTSTKGDALNSVDYAKLPSSTGEGTYDYDSVMHYPANACGGNGAWCATISVKSPNQIWSDGIRTYKHTDGTTNGIYSDDATVVNPEIGQPLTTDGQNTNNASNFCDHLSALDRSGMAAQYGASFSINGKVTTSSGTAVPNVTLTLVGSGNSHYYGPTVTTNSSGQYTLPGVVTGTYVLTPSNGSFTFAPASKTLTMSASQSNANFTINDTTPPNVASISYPFDKEFFQYQHVIKADGGAHDDLGIAYVGIVLKNTSTNAFWDWSTNNWGSTTYNSNVHLKKVMSSDNAPTMSWQLTLPDLTDGDYNLQALAVDLQGNTASQFASEVYRVDQTGPTVTVLSPANNGSVKTLTSISGKATDIDGVVNSDVSFTLNHNSQYWDGTKWTATQTYVSTKTDSNDNWSYTSVPTGTDLTPGTYYISAFASDVIGNMSTPVGGQNQTSFTVDNSPPTCSITTPVDGSSVTGVTSITGIANDDKGIDGNHWDLDIERLSDGKFWDNDHWGDGSATLAVHYDPATKKWNNTGPLPSPGNSNSNTCWTTGAYQIRMIAYDLAGNPSALATSNITYTNTFTWTGATLRDSDPNTGDNLWSNSANWSPTGVPGASDAAIIANGDTVLATGSRSVTALTVSGNSTLQISTLIPKTLTLNGGTITGGTVNSNGGTWTCTGGTIGNTWNLGAGATWNISGTNALNINDGSTINSLGTVNWSGPGSITCSGGSGASTFNNKAGAVFNIKADGTPFATSAGSFFNNQAGSKLTKSAGTGTSLISGWTLNNNSELNAATGTLAYNTALNQNVGSTMTGAGKHNVTGGTMAVGGTTTVVSGANFIQSGGALQSNANFTVVGGATWTWTDGTISGPVNTLNNNGTMTISGTADKVINDGSTFNNTGTINWTGGTLICSGGSGASTFNNKSGGSFNASVNADISTSAGSTFNNLAGAVFTRSGTGTTNVAWTFNNNGTTKCTGGTLTFGGGGTSSGNIQTSNSTLVQFTGGTHTITAAKWTGTGKYQVTGATLTLGGIVTLGDATSPSTLEVLGSGSILNGTGTIAGGNPTRSTLNWQDGAMGGTLTWGAALQTNISDPSSGTTTKTIQDGSTINNDGAVNWTGVGAITCSGGSGASTFNNRSAGSFTASANANFTTSAGSIFNNATGSTFTRSGTGTTQFDWVFNNSGAVQCQGGTLAFNAGGAGNGSISDATGTLVKFTGGTHTLTTPTFTGAGKYQITDNGIVTLNGNLKLGNTTSPSTLEVIGSNSALNGSGTISGGNSTRSTLNWQDGFIGGNLTWASTLQTNISDPSSGTTTKTFQDGSTINNDGPVNWTGVGAITCSGGSGATTFNNRSGGTFTCSGAGIPFTTSAGSTFNNQTGAHFIKTGAGTLTLSGWVYNSASEIQVAAGTVEFTSVLNLTTGAKFTGTGTTNFAGAVSDNAPISSVGPLQITDGAFIPSGTASYTGTGLKWLEGTVVGNFALTANSQWAISGTDGKTLGDGSTINNNGTITWSGGTITCSGGSGASTINNNSGGAFNLAGDGTPFATSAGSIFNNLTGAHFSKTVGTGTTLISGWTYNSGTSSTTANGGETKAGSGTLEFNTALNIMGGTFDGAGKHLWSGGSINTTEPFTIADTTVTWTDGTLTSSSAGAVATTGAGNLNWTGGTLIGTFAIRSNSVFNISGTADKTVSDGSVLNNGGTLTWTGGNIVSSGGAGAATINNVSGGTFNARSTGALTTTVGSKFNNSGTLNIGTSAVAGIFNCGWSYAQSSTGVLNLKVLGSNATTPQFDQLKIGGDASLAGTLNALLSSYVPPANALYKVITHGNRTGTFTKVLTTGSTARYFVAQYNANDVTLQAKQYELAVNDVKVTEGNSGSLNATFTVTLAGTQTLPVTLKYATADVTATAGKDYTATSGTLTFNPGDKTKTVSVPVLGDTIDEADETFNLNLSAPTNAAIVDATGVGTITDDDTSSISIDSPSIAEGNSSTVNLGFTVKLSTANSRTVTVKYATANGSAPIATAGTDYTATSGTLSFAPGETSKTLAVPIKGDLLNELDEKFNLVLFSPTNATISTGTGVGTIKNDDAVPALSAPDVSVTENAGSALFTVNLSAPSGQSITVKYATGISSSGFLATAGTDYTATSGTLTFTPGQTSKTFSVPIKNDTLDEENETYVITLSAPTNATISRLQATGTILDDDASPAVSVNSVAVTEGNSGVVNLNFTLKLSAASGRSVKVAYQTANGATNPATAGTDYVVLPLTSLSFNPGESSKSVTVQVKGDTLDEANETFKLVLSSPVNATLATGTQGSSVGIGTITDDDAAPSLSVDSPSVTEGNSGTVNLTFTLKLSAASGQVISVKYATANATTNPATAGIDYTALPLTSLTFNAGETSKTVVVQVKGDTLDELDEKLNLVLSSPTNATIATSTGVGTIKDDDATPTLSIDSPSILEGNSGTRVMNFTLKLSAASGQVVTVKYLTSNGTALAGSDYITNSGTLTFAAGETSKTVGVTIAGDATVEPNETFKLTLSAPTNATLATAFGTGTITNDDTATNAPSAGGA